MYRSAVLQANRATTGTGDVAAALPADLRFHALHHTYASLCAAGGVGVREVAKFMGHANTTTTEHIYTHLFDTDDHWPRWPRSTPWMRRSWVTLCRSGVSRPAESSRASTA
ncbi:tyrosine-type recombinase/integrase [Mycobacteroides abscessus]|uniref:tyrosine-type recombinase/integrase n=1 Tax=Mycobacteroides abscessus TaxID=36809 RepID=UPI001EED9EE2|nr:tyrosine-type recombinase/integrase [Mycobacteroides abscessus]